MCVRLCAVALSLSLSLAWCLLCRDKHTVTCVTTTLQVRSKPQFDNVASSNVKSIRNSSGLSSVPVAQSHIVSINVSAALPYDRRNGGNLTQPVSPPAHQRSGSEALQGHT
uniref:Putative secreted protein n=1 Tax=Anopheles darlingi TaxID=43151 RepID=A0A2M4D7V9_ANODA